MIFVALPEFQLYCYFLSYGPFLIAPWNSTLTRISINLQLLQMIDNGEGIDISGISDKPLVKRLKKLFRSLKLRESSNGAYLLPPKSVPTLDVVGSALVASGELADNENKNPASPTRQEQPSSNFDVQNKNDSTPEEPAKNDADEQPPKRR